MTTLTENPTVETEPYTEPEPVPGLARFQAPGEGLRLIIEPMQEKLDPLGKKLKIPNTGKTIEFLSDGRNRQVFETTDPDEVEFLRSHPIKERGGFVEVPVPKPPSAPVLNRVIQMTGAQDAEGLAQLWKTETEGWKRDEVLQAIQTAAEALRGPQA